MKNLIGFMIIFLISFIVIMLPCRSLADSFLKYGTGVINSKESKMISTGFRNNLFDSLVYQYEGGIWLDYAEKGRKSSFFFDASAGIEATAGELVLRSTHGIAFISTPDVNIGGYLPNFNHDLYIGIRGKNGNSIGLNYKHISNLGLMPPNIGRDFVSIDLGVPW